MKITCISVDRVDRPLREGRYSWSEGKSVDVFDSTVVRVETDAVRDVDVYLEQPCATYEQCLAVRKRTTLPFALDEVIDSVDLILRRAADRAMDVVNIKISKFGGLTRASQARDLCVSLGNAMTLEDNWGGEIVTAAIAHLAHSTPTELLYTSTDFNSYISTSIASGAPQRINGRVSASTAPGLGVAPLWDVLGDPVGSWSA